MDSRYLEGIINIGLYFGRNTCEISVFVDSNYDDILDRQFSTASYMFKIYDVPFSWWSMLQPTVTLSIIDVEYMEVEKGMKETL